jgi:arylsulfatase
VHWPQRIRNADGLRTQYHHVIDVSPTILDLLGIQAPVTYRGIEQLAMHGISMQYTFNSAGAETRKETQYFELLGDRAIWHKGWKAVERHIKGTDQETDKWELYRLDEDFSECEDLSLTHPEQLQEMIRLWWSEADKYGVLPLDDRGWERASERMKMEFTRRYEFYPGMSRLDRLICPDITDRSYRITADLERTIAEMEGVLLAWGSRFGGMVLYVKGNHLVYEYIYSEMKRYVMRSPQPLELGAARVGVEFKRTGRNSGTAVLQIGGSSVAHAEITKTWPTHGTTAGLYCGSDRGAPLSNEYPSPFPFTGKIHRVLIELETDGERDLSDRYVAALKEQ